jgi:thiol-disulfide isomerase/thioredoxin
MKAMDAPSSPGSSAPEQAPPSNPVVADNRAGRLSPRTRAWIGMGAVIVALVLLMMMSSPAPDPDAPPPAADGGASEATADTGALAVGQDAPLQFTLKDVNGVDVQLASFKGKVILVNFWATWCGPCRVEIPALIELQDAYRDDLVILGVDVLDEFSRVPAFAKELKVNYPMLDANKRTDVEQAYGPMWGLPTTVIINREGKVHRKHSGIASKEQFEQYVKSVL